MVDRQQTPLYDQPYMLRHLKKIVQLRNYR